MGVFRIETDQGTFDFDVDADELTPEQAQALVAEQFGAAQQAPAIAAPVEEEGPGFFRKAVAFAGRVGAPLIGATLGFPVGGIPGAAIGAAIGGGAFEPVARALTGQEQSVLGTLGAAGAAAIPAGPAARIASKLVKPAARVALTAAEGAAQGVIGTQAQVGIEEQRFLTGTEAAAGAVGGALLGGAFGVVVNRGRGARVASVADDAPPVGVKDQAEQLQLLVDDAKPLQDVPLPPEATAAPPPRGLDLQLQPGDGPSAIRARTGEQGADFHIQRDGKPAGNLGLIYNPKTKVLEVDWLEGVVGREGTDTFRGLDTTQPEAGSQFSASEVREVLARALPLFPEATALRFERITGAAGANLEQRIRQVPITAQMRERGARLQVQTPRRESQGELFGPDSFVADRVAAEIDSPTGIKATESLKADFMREATVTATALERLTPQQREQRLFRQLNDTIQRGLFDPAETTKFLAKHGLNMKQFMQDEFLPAITQSGQRLNRLSQIKKALLAVSDDADAREMLDAMALASRQQPLWGKIWQEVRDLDDVGRAAAIGQLATGIRNFATQIGRMSLDVPADLAKIVLQKTGLAKAWGLGGEAGNPWATIQGALRAATPGDTTRILATLDKLDAGGELIARNLFGTSISESVRAGSSRGRAISGLPARMAETYRSGRSEGRLVKTILGPLADAATTINQFQENYFRRARFQGTLQRRAEQKGRTWDDVVENPSLLSEDDYRVAVEEALEVSFAAEPKQGSTAKKFVDAIRAGQPFTTLAIPYPRYMSNYAKFITDFNPLGTLRLVDALIRETRGLEIASRGIVGTGLVAAGFGLRMSPFAGEKWYEMKNDEGERFNLIGLAGPFLPFLFIGELMAQAIDKQETGATTRRPITMKDTIQGTIGIRLAPGAKSFIDLIAKEDTDAPEALQRSVGEWAGRFTVPMRTVKDFAGAFGSKKELLYLDPREVLELGDTRTKLLNPTIQNVPFVGAALDRPPSVSAVTGKDREGFRTALRQLSGVTARETAPIENEIDRLGLSDFKLAPRIGIPKVDRELARRVGFLAQAVAPLILQTPGYQQLTAPQRILVVTELFRRLRAQAMKHLEETNPELVASKQIKSKFNQAKRDVLLEGGVDIEELIFQTARQAPGR